MRVDTRNKHILCGVPAGTATTPNLVLALDYRSLSSAGEIESLGKTVRRWPLAEMVPVED